MCRTACASPDTLLKQREGGTTGEKGGRDMFTFFRFQERNQGANRFDFVVLLHSMAFAMLVSIPRRALIIGVLGVFSFSIG